MSISERIIHIAENSGVGIDQDSIQEGDILCSFYSDAGEDFFFYLSADNDEEFVYQFTEYARDFDPDEHAAMYIDIRGQNGVPDSVRTLIEDADSIKETLENAAIDLNKALKEGSKCY